jgi:hypothetical protein
MVAKSNREETTMREHNVVSSVVCIVTLLFTFNLAAPLAASTVPEPTGTFVTPNMGFVNFQYFDLNGFAGGVSGFGLVIDFGSGHNFEVETPEAEFGHKQRFSG